MKKSYQTTLSDECFSVTDQIDQIVDKHIPHDLFCEVNRETLIRDLQSNVLIMHSPSIIGIIEYSSKSYLYITENILSELNIEPAELIEMGLGRALLSFEEGHRKIFLEVLYPLIFEHYAKYAPLNEAKDLHVSYNTLLQTANGEFKWYHHQLVVLACDEKGFPRYAMKFLSNIHEQKKDDTISFCIHKKSRGREPVLIYSKDVMSHELNDALSPREKEILQLIAEGHSTKAIAEKLYLSEFTISTHRKNIAKKMKTE